MMDIYKILPKHYANNCSAEEHRLVKEFIQSKPAEYKALEILWKQHGKITITDFDSEKAWSKIQQKATIPPKKQVKAFKIDRKWPILGAIAAILVVAIITVPALFRTSKFSSGILLSNCNKTDSVVLITLPDSSKVWLNKNATIAYPSQFNTTNRKVSLEGEAFFEVIRNENKPFIVQTNQSTTTVLGTSFNVNAQLSTTEVIVATGKVKVNLTNNSNLDEILLPGQSALAKNATISKQVNSNVNFLAWKTGKLIFKENSILESVEILNKYFSSKIRIDDSFTSDCLFNSIFEKAELVDILDVLQLSCQFEVIDNGSNLIIK